MKNLKIFLNFSLLLSLALIPSLFHNIKAFDGEDIALEGSYIENTLKPVGEFILDGDYRENDYINVADAINKAFGIVREENNNYLKEPLTKDLDEEDIAKKETNISIDSKGYIVSSMKSTVDKVSDIIITSTKEVIEAVKTLNNNDNLNSVYLKEINREEVNNINLNANYDDSTNTSLSIYNITPFKATLLLNTEDDNKYFLTSNNYLLYRVTDDDLELLERKEDLSNTYYSFNNSYTLNIRWSDVYTILPSGEYLLVKDIALIDNDEIKKNALMVRFSIKDGISPVFPFIDSVKENTTKEKSNILGTLFQNTKSATSFYINSKKDIDEEALEEEYESRKILEDQRVKNMLKRSLEASIKMRKCMTSSMRNGFKTFGPILSKKWRS